MDSRVTLREAAQQALEALEWFNRYGTEEHGPSLRGAEYAIRAALAEPNHDYERGFVEGMSEQARRSVDHAVNAMAERKPLTEEKLWDLWVNPPQELRPVKFRQIRFARAIEQAHGIGGQDAQV